MARVIFQDTRQIGLQDPEVAKVRAQRDRLVEFVRFAGLTRDQVAILVQPDVGRVRTPEERAQTVAEMAGFTGALMLAGTSPEGALVPVAAAAAEQRNLQALAESAAPSLA